VSTIGLNVARLSDGRSEGRGVSRSATNNCFALLTNTSGRSKKAGDSQVFLVFNARQNKTVWQPAGKTAEKVGSPGAEKKKINCIKTGQAKWRALKVGLANLLRGVYGGVAGGRRPISLDVASLLPQLLNLERGPGLPSSAEKIDATGTKKRETRKGVPNRCGFWSTIPTRQTTMQSKVGEKSRVRGGHNFVGGSKKKVAQVAKE